MHHMPWQTSLTQIQDKSVTARAPELHGNPKADAGAAPPPHGWYGHDATTPSERDNKLLARDEATRVAARISARSIEPKADEVSKEKNIRTNRNTPFEYDDDGYIVGVKTARDYPEGFDDSKGRKVAKRFADAGADPSASWFPTKAERSIVDALPAILRRALSPRAPEPIACASHNVGCRSMTEKRAMADALSGSAMQVRRA